MKNRPKIVPFLFGALCATVLSMAYHKLAEEKLIQGIELKEANFIVVDDESGAVLDRVAFGISYKDSVVEQPSRDLPMQLQGPRPNNPHRRAIWVDLEEDPRYVELSRDGYETVFLEAGVATYAGQGGGPIPLPVTIRLKRVQQVSAGNDR